MRPVIFDTEHRSFLDDGTVRVENNMLQSRIVNNSPRMANCPIHRRISLKLGTLRLRSTTSQEELCTMRNFELDA